MDRCKKYDNRVWVCERWKGGKNQKGCKRHRSALPQHEQMWSTIWYGHVKIHFEPLGRLWTTNDITYKSQVWLYMLSLKMTWMPSIRESVHSLLQMTIKKIGHGYAIMCHHYLLSHNFQHIYYLTSISKKHTNFYMMIFAPLPHCRGVTAASLR